jgi:2-haloacid dehalogenase
MITLAFDVYGTLIDPNGVLVLLEKFIRREAKAFSQICRDK